MSSTATSVARPAPARATATPRATGFAQRLFRARAEDVLPLAIEHQRIYILPTRRGWAFLGALLVMLVGAVNYALSLGYALCFVLAGLFAATLLHTYRNLAGIELREVLAEETFAGERVHFVPRLADPNGRERFGLRVTARAGDGETPDASVTVRTEVDASGTAAPALSLPTARRGYRALGRLTIDSDWPLGLWRAWSYAHAPVTALVYPAPEADPPPLPLAPDAGEGRRARADTRGDLAGLRPYVPGDAPATIAWKSLARGQGLHARLFDAERAPSRVCLTLDATALEGTEARLSRLAAWVLAAERDGVDYALELSATSLPAGHGAAQRRAALEALARHGEPRP